MTTATVRLNDNNQLRDLAFYKNNIIRIEGKEYTADFAYTDFKEGDLVIDTLDGSYGWISQCDKNGTYAVSQNSVTEGLIKPIRLLKMKPFPDSPKLQNTNDITGVLY